MDTCSSLDGPISPTQGNLAQWEEGKCITNLHGKALWFLQHVLNPLTYLATQQFPGGFQAPGLAMVAFFGCNTSQ